MLQFPTGPLLLLLTWFGSLVIGEISKDFSLCLQFFYEQTPPQGINADVYRPICQLYENQYRFASLYHRKHRTPLHSAYILHQPDGDCPDCPWMYEPQLESDNNRRDMQSFPEEYNNVMHNQADPRDYTNSGYTKGHLNPSAHQSTREDRVATFTLTNIVPQRKESNTGTWKTLETEVFNRFKDYCEGSMYVITGVIPYVSEIHRINNRVHVPEYMWSAYCCPSYRANLPETVRHSFPTYAAVGRNDPNCEGEIVPINANAKASVRGYGVRQMPLETLEDILRTRLGMNISLFRDQCRNIRD